MDWLQVRIELERHDAAAIEAALIALGASAIAYRDAGDEPLLEPTPGETPLWRQIRMTALLDSNTEPDSVQRVIAAATAPAAAPAMNFEILHERDWAGEYGETLTPMRFGQDLWILPHGADAERGMRAVVRLEPGLAFGSGTHPTTALCLEWLDRAACRGQVLDYGCGSGVLGLAALALGADSAWAVDIDPQALEACAANARRNGLAARMRIGQPEKLPAGQQFDAVVANILCDPLIELAPTLCQHLGAGAAIALSGILRSQAEAVLQAYAQWIEFDTPSTRGDWILLSGRRRVIAA